jgi:hypothetical protein
MGAAVLAHLSQFAKLDGLLERYEGAEEAFVAGQAVASAVSELFYDGLGVAYNDVDVFYMSEHFEAPTNQVLTTLDFNSVRISAHYRQLVVELTTVYEVCHTRRMGMLNDVLCKPKVKFNEFPASTSQMFLASFDLNCVQVGVRLSDGALVWTPAFEEFLATREMLVMNAKTPVHTAIRWFRKKQELEGVFGHDDRTMELLSAVTLRATRDIKPDNTRSFGRVREAQSRFGPQYAAKAREVLPLLGKYFSLDTVEHPHFSLFTLTPTGTPRAELLAEEAWETTLPAYARALQGHWKRHQCQALLDALKPLSSNRRVITHFNACIEGIDYVKSLRSPADAKRLDKALYEHYSMMWLAMSLKTAQQLVLIDTLEELAKERGIWVYGVFEQLTSAEVSELSATPADQLAQGLRDLLDKQMMQFEALTREKPLKALLPSMNLDGYVVEELTTFKEMATETARQHHCVAGYFKAVMEGACRVVRFSKGQAKHSLTMELRPRKGGWYDAQFRGLQNRSATPEERKTAARYVDLVNMSLAVRKSLHVGLPVGLLRHLQTLAPDTVHALSNRISGFIEFPGKRASDFRSRKARTFREVSAMQDRPSRLQEAAMQAVNALGSKDYFKLLWLALRNRSRTARKSFDDVLVQDLFAHILPTPKVVTAGGFDEMDDDLPF